LISEYIFFGLETGDGREEGDERGSALTNYPILLTRKSAARPRWGTRIVQGSTNCTLELEGGEFGFDFGEGGFEGFAADGAGGALVEDAVALEFESLALEAADGGCCVDGILTGFGFG
jgi:hypothetical protein